MMTLVIFMITSLISISFNKDLVNVYRSIIMF